MFKIGDRVRVIKSARSNASRLHFGKIGIVTSSLPEYSATDLDSYHQFWNDELELVPNDWDE